MTYSRKDRLSSHLKKLVARFIHDNLEDSVIVTVTDLQLSQNIRRAQIYISVYPENFEQIILIFLKKNSTKLQRYINSHTKIKRTPSFEFMIDKGEKNRQRIEELLKIID